MTRYSNMFKPLLLWLFLASTLFAGETCELPNPQLTPGAAIPGVRVETLIQRGFASGERQVSKTEKRRVFKLYGISDPRGYVIDHLIPLELGGSNEEANLWPQPAEQAQRKDRLEDRMCVLLRYTYQTEGADAAAALLSRFQREISGNWSWAADCYLLKTKVVAH